MPVTNLLLVTLLVALALMGVMLRRANRRIEGRLAPLSEQLRRIRWSLDRVQEGQRALSIQQGLSALAFKYPVFFHGWCIDPFLAEAILREIERVRPRVILELGSGMSTVFIATVLERLGLHDTRHIAIDHLDEFIQRTRMNLEFQGLGGRTELWTCPLAVQEPDGPPWYQGVAERLAGIEVDLVLVDGPPGRVHPHSRRPALHVLRQFLSERAVLYLDDANRKQEHAAVEEWRAAYPQFAVRVERRGHGYAELRRVPKDEPTRGERT